MGALKSDPIQPRTGGLVKVPIMTPTRYRLSRNLLMLLRERGVTQAEVAEAIGTNQASVNKWINAKAFPGDHSLQRLAEYFEIDPALLLSPDLSEITPEPLSEEAVMRYLGEKLGCDVIVKKR